MSGAETIHDSRTLSEGPPVLPQASILSTRSTNQIGSLTRGQQDRFCSLIFVFPFATRTAAQIGPSCSTGRHRIGRTCLRARTHALARGCEHRGRAGQVPPKSRARPFEAPAGVGEGRQPRLSLGTDVLGSADPEQDMTQGNSIYKTDGTKATAPAAISRANSASESVKKRANNKQVRITRFGFVPASFVLARSNLLTIALLGSDRDEPRAAL